MTNAVNPTTPTKATNGCKTNSNEPEQPSSKYTRPSFNKQFNKKVDINDSIRNTYSRNKDHDEEVAEKVRDFFDLGNNHKKNNVDVLDSGLGVYYTRKSFAYRFLRFEQETNLTMWMLAFCFLLYGPFTANINFGMVQTIMWVSFIYSKVVNIFAKDKKIKTKWFEIILLVILFGKIIHDVKKVDLESKAKRSNTREKNQNRERIRLTGSEYFNDFSKLDLNQNGVIDISDVLKLKNYEVDDFCIWDNNGDQKVTWPEYRNSDTSLSSFFRKQTPTYVINSDSPSMMKYNQRTGTRGLYRRKENVYEFVLDSKNETKTILVKHHDIRQIEPASCDMIDKCEHKVKELARKKYEGTWSNWWNLKMYDITGAPILPYKLGCILSKGTNENSFCLRPSDFK